MHLIVSNRQGELIHLKELQPAGMKLVKPVALEKKDFIPLPAGTVIKPLFGRVPMGYDPDLQKSIRLHDYRGERVFPVSAILPESALQNYRSAYTLELDARRLEPANYTAVGGNEDKIFSAALQLPAPSTTRLDISVEESVQQNEKIAVHLQDDPEHIVVFHSLSELSSELGSIFEKLLNKLEEEKDQCYMVCSAKVLAENPQWKKRFKRISLTANSLQPQFYNRFHSSTKEAFEVMSKQLEILAAESKAALAYQTFPGLTDHPMEMAALTKAIETYNIDHLQVNNIACDPDWYVEELALFRQHRQMLGMQEWWSELNSLDIEIHTVTQHVSTGV
ncbi:MAG: hypothetical protein ACRBF0_05800 [Calditrichia bacterium]